MNAVGMQGRLIYSLTADRLLGSVNTLAPRAFVSGVLLYCWAAVDSLGSLFNLTKMGVQTGMCFSVISIACLTGPPLAGALIQKHDGGFLFAQAFGGSAFIAGSLTLVAARIAKNG